MVRRAFVWAWLVLATVAGCSSRDGGTSAPAALDAKANVDVPGGIGDAADALAQDSVAAGQEAGGEDIVGSDVAIPEDAGDSDVNLPCAPTDCDDGNPCTTDSCLAGACLHTNNSLACDDSNACTSGDLCQGGVCGGTPGPCKCAATSAVQQAYVKPSVVGSHASFGHAIALSGDTLVVGAPGDAYGDSLFGGKAYVFVRQNGTWTQQAALQASNAAANDAFGTSVGISGDTIVVGAPGEASGWTGVGGNGTGKGAPQSGAAYVFVRKDGVWSQQEYLKASMKLPNAAFGSGVAIDGDTIAVGAEREDAKVTKVDGNLVDYGWHSGAAYVFVRQGGNWTQQAHVTPSNIGGQFGRSVALAGDTLVVGAWTESSKATGINGDQSDMSANLAGAAYVFERQGSTWSQQAYLKASNTDKQDLFGSTVATSGDTIVVGADFEQSNATGVNGNQADNSDYGSGAAYVFVRQSGVWTQQAYLKASSLTSRFGSSVGISGDAIVIGAMRDRSSATGVDGEQATEADMSNGKVVAGSGAAYVFLRNGTTWTQHAYLKASNTGKEDTLGTGAAISGETVVVGAEGEASNATGINGNQADDSVPGAGAAYVFFINPSCNDGNPCTNDACAAGTCLHTNNTAPCATGTCSGGVCK